MVSEEIKHLINSFREDVASHKEGNYIKIANKYDDVYADLLIIGEFEKRNIQIALNFWDSWCDASQHEWQYYEGIKKDDWIKLAEIIIVNLKNESEIINPVIVKHFAPENVKGFFQRLKELLFVRKQL